MRTIPTTRPRRRPRQARAQATVDAILEATVRVLIAEGYDRASTNRIATIAGASIGSVYQYFPSKEALVAAVVEAHASKMMVVLEEALAGAPAGSLSDAVGALVAGLVSAYRVDPALHHVLCQEVPKVGELKRVYAFEDRVTELFRRRLSMNADELGAVDIDRAAFVATTATTSVVRASVLADPERQRDDEVIEDVTALALRFLTPEPHLLATPTQPHTQERASA